MCHSEPSSALDSQFAIESPPLFSRCNSLLTFKLSRPRSSLATFSQYQPRSSAYYNLLASALTPQPSRLPAIAQSSSFQQLLPPCCPTTLSRPRGRILTRHRFLTGAPPQSRSYIVAAPPALSHCRRALPLPLPLPPVLTSAPRQKPRHTPIYQLIAPSSLSRATKQLMPTADGCRAPSLHSEHTPPPLSLSAHRSAAALPLTARPALLLPPRRSPVREPCSAIFAGPRASSRACP